MTTRRYCHIDTLIACAAGLSAFALYVRTLAPGLLWGDSAEFQFAAWLGGFVHPTGYPLYLMLGWLWTHVLPWGDPAWRMNLFSALWGGVAVGLLYLVAVRMLQMVEPTPPTPLRAESGSELHDGLVGEPTPPTLLPAREGGESSSSPYRRGGWGVRSLSLAAALIFAVTPTFWSQAVVTEVYTLHAAFVAAILLVALAWADTAGRRSLLRAVASPGVRSSGTGRRSLLRAVASPGVHLYLLAGLVGLSLAHHRTTLLLLPGLITWLFAWNQGFSRLLPLLAKPARASNPPSQKTGGVMRRSLIAAALFLAPLLLYAYTPLVAPHTPYFTVTLGPGQELSLYEPSLRGFIEHVTGSTFRTALGRSAEPWLRALTGRLVGELSWLGLGLGVLGAGWLALRRFRLLILTGLMFLVMAVFNHFYGIGDIFVFYIPVYLIWVLWIAAGLGACAEAIAWAGRRAGLHLRDWGLLLAGVVGLGLAGWLVGPSYAANNRSGDRSARSAWEGILGQPIPPNAILISNDRDEMVPQWYLKYVEARRPDLDGLFPLIQPGPAWADVAAVTQQALLTGRPVYLIKPMPGLEVKFDLEQVSEGTGIGGLVRVLGPAPGGESAVRSGVVFEDRLRLHGYETSPAAVNAGQALTVTLYWDVLASLEHDYTTFVHLVNANGQVVTQSDHRPGGVYYPTSLWRPGERLRDAHRLDIRPDPGPEPYTLVVGLYRLAPDLQHLGSPKQVGQLAGR